MTNGAGGPGYNNGQPGSGQPGSGGWSDQQWGPHDPQPGYGAPGGYPQSYPQQPGQGYPQPAAPDTPNTPYGYPTPGGYAPNYPESGYPSPAPSSGTRQFTGPYDPAGQVPPTGPGYGTGPQSAPGYPPAPASARRRPGLWVWVGVAAVVVVAAALVVTAFLAPGWAMTKKLDNQAAQDGVKKILVSEYSYASDDITAVSCPTEKVKKGNSFVCTATVKNSSLKVTVTFVDDKGTYQVSVPSGG